MIEPLTFFLSQRPYHLHGGISICNDRSQTFIEKGYSAVPEYPHAVEATLTTTARFFKPKVPPGKPGLAIVLKQDDVQYFFAHGFHKKELDRFSYLFRDILKVLLVPPSLQLGGQGFAIISNA